MLRNALCDICPPGSKDIDIRLHQTCTAILFSKPPKPSNQDSSHWKVSLTRKNKKQSIQRFSFPYKLVIYKPTYNWAPPCGRGQTPLFKAAFYGHVSVVEQLLKSGASVEARDSFGRGLSWSAQPPRNAELRKNQPDWGQIYIYIYYYNLLYLYMHIYMF